MVKAMFDVESVGVAKLLEAVSVVAGSVVSKPLVHTTSCKMIVFAMDEGQSISEHHAPYVATVHVLDGRLDFGVAGAQYELGPNDWMVLPVDAKHDLTAVAPTRFLLTLLR
ncbi:MAG TPA: cupin domain-containing protein [Planctomycetota bacterium]|nr:cupin domain-containing protein [Planctomycetota bacterium]